MKVLVVDDVAYSRRALRSVFLSAGYAVISADDGQQALEIVRSELPDLVVTDILMPRLDGFQLCRAIKSGPLTQKIPVIFYTGSYNGSADREFGLSLGASAYLVKPLEAISVRLSDKVFDFDESQMAAYQKNNETESFRFINWEDLSEESVTLPIDKLVVGMLKKRF